MRHIISLSGGIGSWGAGMRVAEEYGPDDMLLVFTDTLIEDADCYRFLLEGAAAILGHDGSGQYAHALRLIPEIPEVTPETIEERKEVLAELRDRTLEVDEQLVWLRDGRTPVGVFFDVGFFGNTRADPCSRVLKRDLYRSWLEERFTPETCTTYVGLDWTEVHRTDAFARNWDPWKVKAPLCGPPLVTKHDLMGWAKNLGIDPPRMYAENFSHANCSGGCVKAGHGQWALLLRQRPEVFRYWEEAEQRFRDETGHDVSILRDRRGGDTTPLTLTMLRDRVVGGAQVDMLDIGGCGCFVDPEAP